MTFRVFTSTQTEALAKEFAKAFAKKTSDPFASRWCVTQSEGMQQWLSLFTAKSNKIMTNCDFLFPVRVLQIIAKLLGENKHSIDEILTWNIYKNLESLAQKHSVLKQYLNKKTQSSSFAYRRYQLAVQMTSIFNRYMSYRIAMLISWSQGKTVFTKNEHEAWQMELWNLLRNEENSPIGGAFNIIEKVALKPQELENELRQIIHLLPKHIFIFGVSELPEVYVNFFEIISKIIDVTLFYLTPCQDFWGDTNKKDKTDNFLLSSWGVLGKNFHNYLIEQNIIGADEIFTSNNTFQAKSGSLLHQLQQQIIHRLPIQDLIHQKDDTSLNIVSHYSRLREVEGLYDFLLKQFSLDPKLKADEIFVLAPKISDYTQEINAVFGQADNENKIPFSIADQSQLSLNPIAKVLIDLFSLAQGRFTALEIFMFIEQGVIKENFQLSEDDLKKIQKWILTSNICWGENRQTISEITQTQEQDIPDNFTQTTWLAGLKRLLVSFIIGDQTSSSTKIFDNAAIIQFQQEDRILLGKFYQICLKIFSLCKKIKQCQQITLEDNDPLGTITWQEIFSEIITFFLGQSKDLEQEKIEIEKSFANLSYRWHEAGLNKDIPFDVARIAIKDHLEKNTNQNQLLRGKVTFCQFQPMRAIPAKIICVLGMNDGNYPHADIKLAFDLMAFIPEQKQIFNHFDGSDKSLSRSERYLFLETFMSAREKFYLSYIGQNNINNQEKMPSVLLQEILNMLENSNISQKEFIVKHPLHAYNAQYFSPENKKLYSYSNLNYEVAQKVYQQASVQNHNWQTLLPKQNFYDFTFEDLELFIINPIDFYIKKSLKINHYKIRNEKLPENEIITFNNLEQKKLIPTFLNNEMSFDYLCCLGKLPWKFCINKNAQDDFISHNFAHLQVIKNELANYHYESDFNRIIIKDFNFDECKVKLSGAFKYIYSQNNSYFQLLTSDKPKNNGKEENNIIKLFLIDLLWKEIGKDAYPDINFAESRLLFAQESKTKKEKTYTCSEIKISLEQQNYSLKELLKWMIIGTQIPLLSYPRYILQKNGTFLERIITTTEKYKDTIIIDREENQLLFHSQFPRHAQLIIENTTKFAQELREAIATTLPINFNGKYQS